MNGKSGNVVRRTSSSVAKKAPNAGSSTCDNDSPLKDGHNKKVAKNPRVFWRLSTSFSSSEEEDSSRGFGLTRETSASSSSSSLSSPSRSNSHVLVLNAPSAQAEELQRCHDGLLEIPVEQQKSYTLVLPPTASSSVNTSTAASISSDEDIASAEEIFVDVDVDKFMASRHMTPLQERWNAITMIPAPIYCICFILSGNWMSQAMVEQAAATAKHNSDNDSLCLDWSSYAADSDNPSWSASMAGFLFQNLHAMPPLPTLFVLMGVVSHFPFSFVYHWTYAHALSPAEKTRHWSRRWDQSMIHVSSALTSYATSGRWEYFFACCLFNLDCIYRQLFQDKVTPASNQARLGAAIFAWALPVWYRGGDDMELFYQIAFVMGLGGFLFVRYPIGGWSHAVFHLALVALMPLLMEVAVRVPASQEPLQQAAHCFAKAGSYY